MAMSRPELIETAMAMRNIQSEEVGPLATAWGKLRAIVGASPRISRTHPKKFGVALLQAAAPELFSARVLTEPLKCIYVQDVDSPSRILEDAFAVVFDPIKVRRLEDVLWSPVLDQKPRLMWEHAGKCACGRKTYLFGECMKCLKEAADDRGARAIDAAGTPSEQEAPSSLAAEEVHHAGATTALIPPVVPGLVSKWTGSITDSVIFFGKAEASKMMEYIQVWLQQLPADRWDDHHCESFLGTKDEYYKELVKYCWREWKIGKSLNLGYGEEKMKKDWPFRTVIVLLKDGEKMTARLVQGCLRDAFENNNWLV